MANYILGDWYYEIFEEDDAPLRWSFFRSREKIYLKVRYKDLTLHHTSSTHISILQSDLQCMLSAYREGQQFLPYLVSYVDTSYGTIRSHFCRTLLSAKSVLDMLARGNDFISSHGLSREAATRELRHLTRAKIVENNNHLGVFEMDGKSLRIRVMN